MSQRPIGTATFVGVRSTHPGATIGAGGGGGAPDAPRPAGGHRVEGGACRGAVYSSSARAIRAAAAARAAADDRLGGETVALAVHAGQADVRDGEYVGPTLDRLQSVLAVAHGGQTVASSVAVELARDDLSDLELRDLGEHRLRDLHRPTRLYQIGPGKYPGPCGVDSVPNNLPTQDTTFVGRREELERGERELAAHRLVTLIGSEGTGKTRLALQLAARVARAFPDGVWVVDVSAVAGPELVPDAVARVLRLRLDPQRDPEESVARYVASRRLLLVFDDVSGVAADVAELVAALRSGGPGLAVVATGSSPMGLPGEAVLAVRPLAVPRPGPEPSAIPALSQYDAVQLFLDRAAESMPGFHADNDNLPAIAQVCHRLDGIPLALELAATRVASLGEERLCEELEDWFERRTGGRAVSLPRHQTLRATVEWSASLLSELDRRLMRRAAVFAGTFAVDAALAVCSDEAVPREATAAALERLRAVALLAPTKAGGYAMPAPVRLVAADRLVDGGEDASLRDRHVDWCLGIAREWYEAVVGPDPAPAIAALDGVRTDLGAALAWGLSRRVPRAGSIELAGRLADYWLTRGEIREGRQWLDKAAAASVAEGVPLEAVALAKMGLGLMAWRAGDYDSARDACLAALAAARSLGDLRLEAWALNNLGLVAYNDGHLDDADRWLLESLERKAALGAAHDTAITLLNLGEVARARGDLTLAAQQYERALAMSASAVPSAGGGGSPTAATALANLGYLALASGDARAAGSRFRMAVEQNRDIGDPMAAAVVITGLACQAAMDGRPDRAARLFGAAHAILDRMGAQLDRTDERDRSAYESLARAALMPDEWRRAWAEGAGLTTDQALAEAVA